jgi:precorrin-2/cobalt-factor-2 C20-methyltransferase
MTGTLYGLGVGPGDPELITVKALRLMEASPVISYPQKGRGDDSYAYKIIESYVNVHEKEMLGYVFSMTNDPDVLHKDWLAAVEGLYQKLAEGKDCVFVTEGDPFLYSTFIYLMRLMEEHHPEVPIKVIPGISSINGAAATLGLPLADGNERIGIIPAQDDYELMKKAIEEHECVIFLKAAKVMKLLINVLRDLNLLDKASVVTKVTSKEEIVWNVEKLENEKIGYLTLMVVRK